jgi:hypothetical protein
MEERHDVTAHEVIYAFTLFMVLVMLLGSVAQFGQAVRWWGPPNATASVGGSIYLLFLAGVFVALNRSAAASSSRDINERHILRWLLGMVPVLIGAFCFAYYVLAPGLAWLIGFKR